MLSAKNIVKTFGKVTALQQVNLDLTAGKVTAVIGENGAGKSTLMKILSGVYTQYEGSLIYKGQPVRFQSTREAEDAGIAIIHQELNLVPYLSVSDNIFLGREIRHSIGLLDKKAMHTVTRELLSRLHLDLDPATPVYKLKVGQQQLVEIAKALHGKAEVLIMDEPTSAITDREAEQLFEIIGKLKKEGKAIAYISHKLSELFRIADDYTVLRDGVTVGQGSIRDINREKLVTMMAGRNIVSESRPAPQEIREPLLELRNIRLRHPENSAEDLLKDIDLTLHRAEILGLYGIMGAGRTELMETIFGLHPEHGSGSVQMEGHRLRLRRPSDAIDAGIMLIPEDRKLQGLCVDLKLRSNMSITILRQLEQWGLRIGRKKEQAFTADYMGQLGIKAPSAESPVRQLSGGNQQKIVLAKWLARHPRVLLLDEPTRGIDVAAKAEIYKLIQQLASSGVGVIVVSSEIPEVLALSHRIIVMCEGRLTADLPAEVATEALLLEHAIHQN
ncbi:sugar ABC transporter ATP-binding protein [Niabella terrae]